MSARALSVDESSNIFNTKRVRSKPKESPTTRVVSDTSLVDLPPTPEQIQDKIALSSNLADLAIKRQEQIINQSVNDNAIIDENAKSAKPITDVINESMAKQEARNDALDKMTAAMHAELMAKIEATMKAIIDSSNVSSNERLEMFTELTKITAAINDTSGVSTKAISDRIDGINDKLDSLEVTIKPKVKAESSSDDTKDIKEAKKLSREDRPLWKDFKKNITSFPLVKRKGTSQSYEFTGSSLSFKKGEDNSLKVFDSSDNTKRTFKIDKGFYSIMRALDGTKSVDADAETGSIGLAKYLVSKKLLDQQQLPETTDTESSAPIGEGLNTPQYYLGKTDYEKGFIKVYKTQTGVKQVRPKAVYTAPLSADLVDLLSNQKMSRSRTYSAEAIAAFKAIYSYIPESMVIGRQSSKYALIHGKKPPQSKATQISIPTKVADIAKKLKLNMDAIAIGNTNKLLKQQSLAMVDALLSSNVISVEDASEYRDAIGSP